MKNETKKKQLCVRTQMRAGVTCQQCKNDFNQESQHCTGMPGTYGGSARDECYAELNDTNDACLKNCTGPIVLSS